MGVLSPRVNRIKPSLSSMTVKKVRELKAAGIDLIGLTMGEPDFDTPPLIAEAAARAIAESRTKYTNVEGTPELKQAIQGKFKRENALEYEMDEIVVGNGAKQLIFNAILATVSAGDEVIVPVPYWVSYPDIVLLGNGTPVYVVCPPDAGFKMRPDDLEQAITPRTKWLILNSPCNPSGIFYTSEELAAIARVLLRHPQTWVLTDDIYEHLLYDGRRFATIAQVEPELKQRTLTVNGVSKAYAMTGWRIGYAGGPAELIKAMVKLQSQSTSCACSISQAAAVEALTGPQDLVLERARRFQERRDFVVDQLNRIPGIACHVPDGAFYIFASCRDLIGRQTPTGKVIQSDSDFVMYLLDSFHVAVLQGDAYGMSPFFRLSFATSLDTLKEGCSRIHDACESLR